MNPEDIIAYWVDEVGPKGWYAAGDELDQAVRDRFGAAWQEAAEGGFGLWLTGARDTLAYIILTDQFPRNMFRNDPRAYSTDSCARAATKVAIDRDWDLLIAEPARQFFYLPLMHSENLIDQDRCVRLVLTRMPEGGESTLLHAKAHRDIIRKFGRFPYRNGPLGRQTTPAEAEFMETGGYSALIRSLKEGSEPA